MRLLLFIIIYLYKTCTSTSTSLRHDCRQANILTTTGNALRKHSLDGCTKTNGRTVHGSMPGMPSADQRRGRNVVGSRIDPPANPDPQEFHGTADLCSSNSRLQTLADADFPWILTTGNNMVYDPSLILRQFRQQEDVDE